jgi:hypothetical protein
MMRFFTVAGTFANLSWGGNHDKVGGILGFEDRFIWQPPIRRLRRRRHPGQVERHAPTSVRFQPKDRVDFVVVGSGAAGERREGARDRHSVVAGEAAPDPSQFEHDEFKYFFRNGSQRPAANFRPTPSEDARQAPAGCCTPG